MKIISVSFVVTKFWNPVVITKQRGRMTELALLPQNLDNILGVGGCEL